MNLIVSCGDWQLDVGSKPFEWVAVWGLSCVLAHSGASHGCLIGLGFGAFGGKVNNLGSLLCSSSNFWTDFTGWQAAEGHWSWECHYMELCIWSGGWYMSSNIHMNASTQDFPVERCIVLKWWMLFNSAVIGFNYTAWMGASGAMALNLMPNYWNKSQSGFKHSDSCILCQILKQYKC